jgi:DNA-binding MarR family transcriptional regulator
MKGQTGMGRIGSVFLTWRRWLQKGYARYGVTLKQSFLLNRLASHEYLHPADIAEALFCDRPTASVIIRNMEKAGWVKRQVDPTNGKRQRVVLTKAGLAKRDEIRKDPFNPERRFDPQSCFSGQELEDFKNLLEKLEKHLESLPEI